MSTDEAKPEAPLDPEAYKLAKGAVAHVLNAICDDPRKFWLMGFGTESYAKLTAAHAALHSVSVEDVRANFVPDKAVYGRYCKRLKEEERLIEIGRAHAATQEDET